jgi:hypothetical protein
MSRLARSCKDWHALLELCGIYRTLLADADGLYNPSDYNDRLLLGLKGTMSEAELHILKSRLQQGMWNKAERGEILNHPPIGYLRSASARNGAGDYVIDPDEQVQSVVRLIFEKFQQRGSINSLLRSLVREDVKVPVRPHSGSERGELQWRRPNRVTLLNMLHHPIYAGAYRWGHRETDPRKQIAGRPTTGRTYKAHDECRVLIRDRFEAYPGLFTMRGRRHGESLFHWGIAPRLWFQQVTHDVKFTNLKTCLGVRRIASKGKPDACRRE